MKTVYPLGLSALLFLSGCSTFMGGRFAAVGERFASMRQHDGASAVRANRVESPAQELPAPDAVVSDSKRLSGVTVVVEDVAPKEEKPRKMVRVEKVEAQRPLPDPAPPAPLDIASLPSGKEDGKRGFSPALISNDVATEASEESTLAPAAESVLTRDGSPLQYLRNHRLQLDYEVRGAGPSGVATVELWYTRDGRHWSKADVLAKQPPYLVNFGDEGRYGITLVARNGVGAGQTAPAEGDKPQAWVEIDSTRPDVIMSGVKFNPMTRVLSIAWSAADRHLDPHSVCLSYGTEPDGPWSPIAQNVENLGKYDWKVDLEEGQHFFYVRVEVMDLAGNVGSAKTLVDLAKPTATITKLEEAP